MSCWVLLADQTTRPNPRHITTLMRTRVVLLHDLQYLFIAMRIRNWIHWLDLSTAAGVLTVTVQASLGGVVFADYAAGGTATLRITERLVTNITSIRWIALHAIIHTTNLDNRWTLLQLHNGALFTRLMVRI